MIKGITVHELKEMMDKGENYQLIDVREDSEYAYANIGGEHIPLRTLPHNTDKISRDPERKVIVHCRSGHRSASAVEFLQENKGFKNVYNLEGGILAWSDEIDQNMPRY